MSFTQTTQYSAPGYDMDVTMASPSGSTRSLTLGLGSGDAGGQNSVNEGGSDASGPADAHAQHCAHIDAAFAVEATRQSMLKKYKAAVAWAASTGPCCGRPAKRRKLQTPSCGTCGLALHRPFICLHCSYGGCWKDEHILLHLKDLGHQLCADVKSGSVYCSECDNMITNLTFEELYRTTILHVEEKETKFVSSKKRRENYKPWSPEAKDISALEGATPISCNGRIGLLNLGQTCFLNVVVQSLLHNPMIRNYFLSDMHNNKQCKTKECMCCEMDKLFIEVYTGKNSVFGPASLLATTWRSSSDLAGYAQQDAHEFFISALNQLHKSAYGSTSVSCNCVVHEVFGGQLQSDHTCDKCGAVSSKVDPILDVSLQLKGKGAEDNTLAGCLRRFTHAESMKFSCSACGNASQTGTKRLSIRKLPPVLSFQFKRFEHSGQNGKSSPKKIDTHIRFPAHLNMLPFTTLALKAQKEADKEPYLGPETLYEYDLFAVINHEGQIDNGHYTSFARSQDEWYRFDDDKVTHSSLDAALKSTAYMCFYVKRHLDYKPFSLPTYKIARESEAVKEKEKEREKEAARMKEVEDALLATV